MVSSKFSRHIFFLNNTLLLLCTFFTFNLQSCKQHGRVARSAGQPHTVAEPKYKAGLHLQKGAKYYYTVVNNTTTTFEANSKKIENTNNVKAGLVYEVLRDTAGGYLIKMTYDHFNVVLKNADDEKEMDSDNGANSIDPVERMFGALKGSFLLITINSKGRVTAVSGYKELTDKIMSGVTTQNALDKQKMHDQLENTFGEGFVKNNMEQGFSMLPDTAVYIGDSWVKTQAQVSEINMNIASTYTLSSIEDNIAEIDATANIDDHDNNLNLLGYPVAVNLKGDEDGTYKADINTGMLIKGILDISIKGTIEVQGKEVPLHIKVKKEISVKKL